MAISSNKPNRRLDYSALFRMPALLVTTVLLLCMGSSPLTDPSTTGYGLLWLEVIATISCLTLFLFVTRTERRQWQFGLSLCVLTTYLLTSAVLSSSEYGVSKVFVGLAIPMALSCVVKVRSFDTTDVANGIIISSLLVAFVAIVYKIEHGLFDRQVRFGLLGPITFGWVCGLGILACCSKGNAFGGRASLAIGIALSCLMVWSESKGPLLATILCLPMVFPKELRGVISAKALVSTAVFIVSILLVSYLALEYTDFQFRPLLAVVSIATDADGYIAGSGSGSLGVRLVFAEESLSIWGDNVLFGTGFGTWGLVTGYAPDIRYPHNIFLETLSECGLFGATALVITVASIWRISRHSFLFAPIVFLLIVSQFSGDLSYFRYCLLLTFLSMQSVSIDNVKPLEALRAVNS